MHRYADATQWFAAKLELQETPWSPDECIELRRVAALIALRCPSQMAGLWFNFRSHGEAEVKRIVRTGHPDTSKEQIWLEATNNNDHSWVFMRIASENVRKPLRSGDGGQSRWAEKWVDVVHLMNAKSNIAETTEPQIWLQSNLGLLYLI